MKRYLAFTALCIWGFIPSAYAQWEVGPSLPVGLTERNHAVGMNLNGTLYAIGGSPMTNGLEDGAVHQLLLGATSWVEVSPLGGVASFMYQGGGVDALGRMMIFGGEFTVDPFEGPPGPFTYEPIDGPAGGLAARSAAAPFGRFAWCTDNLGRIYSLGGGAGMNTIMPNSAHCERYDALTDLWSVISPMNLPVADAAAACDGSRILVFGGFDALGLTRSSNVAVYDIATNTWSDLMAPDMPAALTGASAVVGVDGRFYVMGGATGPVGAGTVTNTCYILEADLSSWSVGPSMMDARQWFGATLGDDNFIYVIGGNNDTGGTIGVEKFLTVPCPTFVQEPIDAITYLGTVAGFYADAIGGVPISYTWFKDGVELVDGITVSGSEITGSNTKSLNIWSPTTSDEGTYSVIAYNSCGSTPSEVGGILQVIAPEAVGSQWEVVNIHPLWSTSSTASGIEAGVIAGTAKSLDPIYGYLDQSVVWMDETTAGVNFTPSNSVGSEIYDFKNGVAVGWYWRPYMCNAGQTCYFKVASKWELTGNSWVHTDIHTQAEYDYAYATDGTTHVGVNWSDWPYTNTIYRVWKPTGSYTSIGGVGRAVDNGIIYGTIDEGAGTQAAKWFHTPSVGINMGPPGASTSFIEGAASNQQVGRATIDGGTRAWLFAGSPGASLDLNPIGSSSSSAINCNRGVQVGNATIGSTLSAIMWRGSPTDYVNLHSFLPSNFAYSYATGIDFDAPDGRARICGYGYNSTNSRLEALVWINLPNYCSIDIDGDGTATINDLLALIAAWGTNGLGADLAVPFNIVEVNDLLFFVSNWGTCQ